jgi:hypothetical protein
MQSFTIESDDGGSSRGGAAKFGNLRNVPDYL